MILNHPSLKPKFIRRGQLALLPLLLVLFCPGCKSSPEQEPPEAIAESEALLHYGTEALRQHEFRLALALTDSADKITPNRANVEFLRARIYSELGRFEKAETSYRRVLELEPDYRGVWNNLGNNAFRKQEYSQSIVYYQKEIASHPAPIPWRGMGRAYVELGKVDSALYAFHQAIAIDSLYDPVYLNLTFLHEDEGEFETALRYAQKAVQLDSENVEYHYYLGALLVKVGRPEEALRHLHLVAEKWPWHHGAQYNLGQALVHLGRQEEAKKYLKKAEQVRALRARIEHLENTVNSIPDDPLAYASLAFAYRRAGRYNDAMHAYKVAHYLAPQNVEIQNNIANLYLIRGDTTRAINQYRTILRDNPMFLDIWLNLGVVYALSGKTEAARQAWQYVLRYAPNHPAAKAYLEKLQDEP